MPRVRRTLKRSRKLMRSRRARRMNRIGRQFGTLTTKRYVNLSSSASLVVDGTYCYKQNNFVFFTTPSGLGNNAQVVGGGSIYFSLASVPSANEYGVMFDRYRINGIQLRIIPLATSVGTENTANNISLQSFQEVPLMLHIVQDFDDAQLPSFSENGINELRQYPNYRCINIYQNQGKAHTIYIRPKVAKNVYAGIGTNAYESARFPWIDMDNQDAQGYGFKFIMESLSKTEYSTVQAFKFEATYYLSFKNPR